MGWSQIPKPPPTPPGHWEEIGTNPSDRQWLLRCPPAFAARITQSGGVPYLEMNLKGYGAQKSLEAAQVVAELEMIRSIREMLPVYKLLVERQERRHDKNIIPIKPKDGA